MTSVFFHLTVDDGGFLFHVDRSDLHSPTLIYILDDKILIRRRNVFVKETETENLIMVKWPAEEVAAE